MAYNYYQPMGYTPMYNQQPLPQPQPQIQPQAYANTGIVWVADYNEAAMYPIAPNAAVALWDKNAPCIYLKRADATGKPFLQVYDLVERKEQPRNTSAEPRYATQDALEQLSRTVDGIIDRLNEKPVKTQIRAFGDGVTENE